MNFIVWIALVFLQHETVISTVDLACITVKCDNETIPLHSLSNNCTKKNTAVIKFSLYSATTLDDLVSFHNKHEVVIKGMGSEAIPIVCTGKDSTLRFVNTRKICIENIQMLNCGGIFVHHTKRCNSSAIFFSNATKIDLNNVEITNSKCTGIVLDNTTQFSANHLTISNCSGQGMNITGHHSLISISDSLFKGNNKDHFKEEKQCWQSPQYHGGGGISARFLYENVTLKVERSVFVDNRAVYGGGVALDLQNTSVSVIFRECNFTNNLGHHGGGVFMRIESVKQVLFQSTTWEANYGHYGSAVMVKPCERCQKDKCSLFQPIFENCTFDGNVARTCAHMINNASNFFLSSRPKGIIYTRDISLMFKGTNIFTDNNISAIYSISSDIIIHSESQMYFANNSGYEGGAIALYFSKLEIDDNVTLSFEFNSATYQGGAIFQKEQIFEEDRRFNTCFMKLRKYKSKLTKTRIFNFNGNHAEKEGDSLFVSSVTQCHKFRSSHNLTCTEKFNQYATFTFSECKSSEIETTGSDYSVDNNPSILHLIPGKPSDLGISILDDMGKPINTVVRAQILSFNGTIELPPAYDFITNNDIVLLGQENSTAILILNLPDYKNYIINVIVKLLPCPPGLQSMNNTCKCLADKSSDTHLEGIDKCDKDNFTAHLRGGYWAGYLEPKLGKATTRKISTALCPIHFCDSPSQVFNGTWLPINETKLTEVVCSPNKTGVLCGNCTETHSVFFHDITFSCLENKKCNLGILLYLVSELLPATIFFLVIVSFDITFTSGAISGFIFYMQIFDMLVLHGDSTVQHYSMVMLQIFYFTARMFNLTFFSLRELSFCIIKNANALDMIAFNYFTLIYCFILMIAAIALKNKYCIKLNFYFRIKKTLLSDSIINGLSSFLVLCYYQGTKTSILLISYIDVGTNNYTEKRVFYNADMAFMKDGHIKYAIPAIMFLTLVTSILPSLLFWYPLCYKILSACHLQESIFTKLMCRIIPLEKYKPVFDSFQSTFKDDHRYFSGLHFIFRFSVLLLFIPHGERIFTYIELNMLFLLMLVLHAIQRPYKQDRHNVLDCLIYTLLIVLNTITLLSYYYKQSRKRHSDWITYTFPIQVLLAWLPAVCLIGYLGSKTVGKVKILCAKLTKKKSSRPDMLEFSTSVVELEENRRKMDINFEKW